MEISVRKEKNAMVVSVSGRLDAMTAPDLEARLDEIIEGGLTRLVVNLSDLEYISSAGLTSILASAKKVKALSGEMVFAGLQGPVHEVLRISGFELVFKVFASEGEALDYL